MRNPAPVLQATGLTKRYGAQLAVQDVSFALAAGETLVLLGPSGCGKTTLLRLLNRLLEPDAGTVCVNGQDVRTQPAAQLRRGMGYVIQHVGLLPHYTVAENVAVVPQLLGQDAAHIVRRTEELLTRLHLPPARFAGQYPHQLSGGQQQRVGLARALAADPPIILLDEPFGALDPITRASIRREFRELPELRRKTMVLVTHDVTEAVELADQILLLDAGRVQQLGPPRELLFRPANELVRRFFAPERLALQLRVIQLADVLADLRRDAEVYNTTNYQSEVIAVSSAVTIHYLLERLSQVAPEVLASATPRGGEQPEPVLWLRVSDAAAALPVTYASLMAAFGRAAQRFTQV